MIIGRIRTKIKNVQLKKLYDYKIQQILLKSVASIIIR